MLHINKPNTKIYKLEEKGEEKNETQQEMNTKKEKKKLKIIFFLHLIIK